MKVILSICLILNFWVGLSFVSAQQTGVVTYAIKQTETGEIEITATENRIKVVNAPIGSRLQVYSVVGIKVKEFEIKQSDSEYVLNIAKGYYIIRIGETVRKIVIR